MIMRDRYDMGFDAAFRVVQKTALKLSRASGRQAAREVREGWGSGTDLEVTSARVDGAKAALDALRAFHAKRLKRRKA